ncbi:hypothetical protein SDC9_157841 [bioreactor metagenome]|uniref:Uncharacterized protein n=1 Tax=bioreactor metagenome TaxID=1076179 RepID=A0A645FAA8_9ZZZZ
MIRGIITQNRLSVRFAQLFLGLSDNTRYGWGYDESENQQNRQNHDQFNQRKALFFIFHGTP